MASSRPIPLGKLVAGHGVRGLARIRPFNPQSATLPRCAKLWLMPPGGSEPTCFRVSACRPHGNVFLVQLDGVASLNELEPWIGSQVEVPAESLPAASAGEVYHFEAIGLSVCTGDGTEVGVVVDVMALPANDVWVVRPRDAEPSTTAEALIPVVAPIVTHIDLAARTATIDPVDGLLDGLRP
jgi:16S rRNA processing protein RimM